MSSRAKRDRIAFIGLGMMGYPLAGHLAAAGFSLAVFDLNPIALRKCGGNFPCRICSTALEAV
jgi:3-hydroxyisobutyrate dehydrogenase-like beta-hydroxyacid dehydrogenase